MKRATTHALVACVLSLLFCAQIAGATDPTTAGADEPIAVSDAVTVTPPAATATGEHLSVLDSAAVFPPAAAASGESVAVGDAVGVFPSVSAAADEAARVTDAVGVFPPASQVVDESAHVADDVLVSPSPFVTSSESVAVGDAVTVAAAPVLAVDESAHVADSVLVEAQLFPTQTSLIPQTEPLLAGRSESLSVTVTAGGAPATSGDVTLKEGDVTIAGPQTVDGTGHATFTVDSLKLGSHTLTASFDGMPLFRPSTGTTTVDVYDYALSLSPSAQPVQRGTAASYSLTAALVAGSSTGGSTATLALSVSGVPSGATATFSGPLALPALGTTTLQVATTPTTTPGDATLVVAGDGGARTASAHLYVNAPPSVSAGGPYTVAEGSNVALISTATDADHDTLTAAWDLNGDGTFETPGLTASFHGVDGPANVPVRLRVCDDHGACATTSAAVTVTNVAPTARITAPADGTVVFTGTPVSFVGSFTDPGTLDTQTATWSFGATGLTATRTFTAAGFPTVTLTIRDKDGGVGTASIGLVVVNPHASVAGAGWFRTSAGRTAFVFAAAYAGTTPRGLAVVDTPLGTVYSTAYRYLVVSGSTFELDGLGTFNGARNVSFHLSGVNGHPDRLRVRIGTVYDSGGPIALSPGEILIGG